MVGGDDVVADGGEAGDESSAGAPVDAEEPVSHVAPGHGGEELSVLSDDSVYELIDVDPTTVEGVRAWFRWNETSRWMNGLPPYFPE